VAWVTPVIRATGDLISAAVWNQDVVNNPKHLFDDLSKNYYYRSHLRQATWVLDSYVKHPIGTGHKQESDGSASWDIAGPTAIKVPVAGNYLLVAVIKCQWNTTIEARFKYGGVVIEDFGINGYPTGSGSIAPYVTFAITKVLAPAGHNIELEIKPTVHLPVAGNMVAQVMIARIR